MKLADVVNQIQIILPKYTDYLSTAISVDSITASSGTATIRTSDAHGITTGQAVTLSGVTSQTPISNVAKSGNTYTFTTSQDHDLTYGWADHAEITLSGFTDDDWNDSFTLSDVPNRSTFKVISTNSEPTLNGNEVLLEERVDGVNGRYSATVTNKKTFTILGSFNDGDYIGGTVHGKVRVAGAVTIEEALEKYTKQGIADLWCFVVMNDADTSKSRSAYSDATGTIAQGNDIRIRLIDGFTVTFVMNATATSAGQNAVDICRHELLQPILKTLYGAKFDTGLDGNMDFSVILTGHGIASYNRAIYAHTYGFEAVMDLTSSDAVDPIDTRAFRDINFTYSVEDDNTEDLTVIGLDLDDEPL